MLECFCAGFKISNCTTLSISFTLQISFRQYFKSFRYLSKTINILFSSSPSPLHIPRSRYFSIYVQFILFSIFQFIIYENSKVTELLKIAWVLLNFNFPHINLLSLSFSRKLKTSLRTLKSYNFSM